MPEKYYVKKNAKGSKKIRVPMCQIIPDELDSNAEGKDFSHITLYPQCLCNNCEHKKDCMGII